MKLLLILPLLLLITSCGKTIVKTEYVEVEVPVIIECPVPPASEAVERIQLSPLDRNNFDKIVKTTQINTSNLKNKVEELETILDGYR